MQAITKVFSDIVKPYIDTADENLQNQLNINGAKNLLPVTVSEIKKNNTSNGAWNGNVFTTTGGRLTFTINTTDGATVDSIRVQTNPSGTGVTAYALYVFDGSKKLTAPTIYTPISDNDAVFSPFSCACTVDGTNYAVNNGAKNTDLPAGTLTKSWIYSESGSTVDETFYPMIRLASDSDSTYQPYAMTNQELTSENQTLKTLVVSVPSFSSLPQTISNASVTSDMVVVNSVLGNPSAQTSDWTVTTSNGSLTISGSISGSTTATLYLTRSRTERED